MTRLTGRVKWFSTEKGYGFIEREGADDVFVHRSEIRGSGSAILEEGERVEFDVESSPRGLKARSVLRAEPDQPGGTVTEAVAGSGTSTRASESRLSTLEEQILSRLGRRILRRI